MGSAGHGVLSTLRRYVAEVYGKVFGVMDGVSEGVSEFFFQLLENLSVFFSAITL